MVLNKLRNGGSPGYIGDKAVITGGALAVKDVPADTVLGGVPAKVLKKITD